MTAINMHEKYGEINILCVLKISFQIVSLIVTTEIVALSYSIVTNC